MGVDRSIKLRIVTNHGYFSEIVQILHEEGYSFDEDGTVVSLLENDVDDFDYVKFESFEGVKEVLNKREDHGFPNYIVMWDKSIDDSLLISAKKVGCNYKDYKSQYEIAFGIGNGIRIAGADRYTDFGVYLKKLLPSFIRNSIYICQVECCDFDC